MTSKSKGSGWKPHILTRKWKENKKITPLIVLNTNNSNTKKAKKKVNQTKQQQKHKTTKRTTLEERMWKQAWSSCYIWETHLNNKERYHLGGKEWQKKIDTRMKEAFLANLIHEKKYTFTKKLKEKAK